MNRHKGSYPRCHYSRYRMMLELTHAGYCKAIEFHLPPSTANRFSLDCYSHLKFYWMHLWLPAIFPTMKLQLNLDLTIREYPIPTILFPMIEWASWIDDFYRIACLRQEYISTPEEISTQDSINHLFLVFYSVNIVPSLKILYHPRFILRRIYSSHIFLESFLTPIGTVVSLFFHGCFAVRSWNISR